MREREKHDDLQTPQQKDPAQEPLVLGIDLQRPNDRPRKHQSCDIQDRLGGCGSCVHGIVVDGFPAGLNGPIDGYRYCLEQGCEEERQKPGTDDGVHDIDGQSESSGREELDVEEEDGESDEGDIGQVAELYHEEDLRFVRRRRPRFAEDGLKTFPKTTRWLGSRCST